MPIILIARFLSSGIEARMAFDQILLNAFHHQFLALVVYGGCQRHDARRAPALKIRNLEMRIERVAGVHRLEKAAWIAR